MKTTTPPQILLKDYRPSPYLIDEVHLDFSLETERTRIRSQLKMRPNPDIADTDVPLNLDGEEIELKSISLNGVPLSKDQYETTDSHLIILSPPKEKFQLDIETECQPDKNTALSGLYCTNETFCTQCEAEGFRRITYYLDRPDILAKFTTRIDADTKTCPVLLSNGNLIETGELDGDRHFAIWHDPHPKPAYLFALVGGDLARVDDQFTTRSGRDVQLSIFVEHGKEDRTDYAMDALKRSMLWDEKVYGCEYDLDIFMIVAVSHFNMGAMENKGLNIFNDKYVLARPDTATDADYANIEAIIAHEYFHNWTGNRVTCRDWFQLCLKEGLTVFRDQEFSSDERSRPVKRIKDVKLLRSHQFPEDGGPLSHPVRPQQYLEINNFYTATVYEKGAELVRMLHTLLGAKKFQKAITYYLEQNDGKAATVEDFIEAMEKIGQCDLSQFMKWYHQAGTPEINMSSSYSKKNSEFTLTLTQTSKPSSDQPIKEALHMPFKIGLLQRSGDVLELDERVIELKGYEESFVFKNIENKPIVSFNRGFTAPVRITSNKSDSDLLFLMEHDADPFNKWETVQTYSIRLLSRVIQAFKTDGRPRQGTRLAGALTSILSDPKLEPAYLAEIMRLPGVSDLIREAGEPVDPDLIQKAVKHLKSSLAALMKQSLIYVIQRNETPEPYSPDANSAGKRALKNTALELLSASDDFDVIARVEAQYVNSRNMTDTVAALSILTHIECEAREKVFSDFHDKWQTDALVLDKWFSLQACSNLENTIERVEKLLSHPGFSHKNPNRVRALIGSFATANPVQFSRADGKGFEFMTDQILTIDPINPQIAARLSSCFKNWNMLEPVRSKQAYASLERICRAKNLSKDTYEIVSKSLKK